MAFCNRRHAAPATGPALVWALLWAFLDGRNGRRRSELKGLVRPDPCRRWVGVAIQAAGAEKAEGSAACNRLRAEGSLPLAQPLLLASRSLPSDGRLATG